MPKKTVKRKMLPEGDKIRFEDGTEYTYDGYTRHKEGTITLHNVQEVTRP